MSMTEVDFIKKFDRPMRDKVVEIEALMKKQPQLDLKVTNHFSDGVYARELFIPKDTIVVGKIHKFENLNMMIKGEMSVLIGENIERVKAPFIVVSKAGTKRIAYTHEDSIWVTIHGTHETDLEKIEDHFIAKSELEYLEFCKGQPTLPFEG